MTALRLIAERGRSARENIALGAAMVELRAKDEIPDTLRIYSYPRSVLLGRNQDATRAADLSFCEREGIEVARRITGGGAIYMDQGVVTWDLALASRAHSDISTLAATVCKAIAIGISGLGVAAYFRAENDIVIGARKVAGASGYRDGAALIYQGSLMIMPDLSTMAAALRLAPVNAHITSLGQELGYVPENEAVFLLLADAAANALNATPERSSWTKQERVLASQMLDDEIGRDDFVFQGEAGGRFAPPLPRLSSVEAAAQ